MTIIVCAVCVLAVVGYYEILNSTNTLVQDAIDMIVDRVDMVEDNILTVVDDVTETIPDISGISATDPAPEATTSHLDRTAHSVNTTHGSLLVSEPEPTKAKLIENLIYALTNQHRVVGGLQPLERVSLIDQIARSHSEDMAKRNYFEHNTPEGLDPTQRGMAAGYDCRKDYGSHYTYGLAENIHMHTGTWYSAEHLADEIMEGWMRSPGHRQNIMEPNYDRIGIGVAIGGGTVYATQNFC